MDIDVPADALSDPRYQLLAKRAGINVYESLGRCFAVWRECLRSDRTVLPRDELDAAAGLDGFADAMIAARLARDDSAGVYVSGSAERLAWHRSMSERNSRGGKSRAEKGLRATDGRFSTPASVQPESSHRLVQGGPAYPASVQPDPAPLPLPLPCTAVGGDPLQPPAVAPTAGTPAARSKRPAASTKNGKPRQLHGPVGEALRHFDACARSVTGSPYLAAFSRDTKILRDVLRQYGLPRTLETISAFWGEIEGHVNGLDADNNGRPTRFTGRARPDIPGYLGQLPALNRDWHWKTPLAPESKC